MGPMSKKRYSEEQIIKVLKEAEAGAPVAELCRKYGISEPTVYNWKAKYGGLEVSELRRLKTLEDENRRLKHLVADLTLDNQALKAISSKNW
jgi:putative transposase